MSYERPPQRIRSETDRFGGPRGVNRAVLSIVLRAMLGIDADHRFATAAPVGGNRSPANSARRQFIVGAARRVGAFFLLWSFARDGSSNSSGSTSSSASGSPNESRTEASAASQTCMLYPEETEGPYYRDVDLVRRDIAEGRPGTPLTIVLQLLRERGCDPISGVDVEIWHADARGAYSDENTAGETFLRGTQTTDKSGRVKFETVYPGWYPGRTTHVHFKAHLSVSSVVTSQVYFPESVTAAVYATAPYATRGPKDTSNADDSVYAASAPPLLAVISSGSGYFGELTITVAA